MGTAQGTHLTYGADPMATPDRILLLTDNTDHAMAADLDVLYPECVECMDFRSAKHTAELLRKYSTVITMVTSGEHLVDLDYAAVSEYARGGGQVISCLFEYSCARDLQFSKTHVMDRMRPGMQIELDHDVTRGYASGDLVWWFGTPSSAADTLYENQMVQRQITGLSTAGEVSVLARSTVNGGAVMVEEKLGEGRIVAMDLLSLVRPWFNSHGGTNKYLFVGNVINHTVRYGKHYPERLSYDLFVQQMHRLADQHEELSLDDEGPCSDGRSMWSFSLGDADRPTVFLGAAIHGWEWENAFGLLRLTELLCEQPKIEGLDTRRLHYRVLPIQNPWGYDHFTRHNSQGIDLNRNFDCGWDAYDHPQDVPMPWDYSYKGTRSASERETQVVQGIIDRYAPACVIDFHTADYVMMLPHQGNRKLLDAIHQNIRARLRNRFLVQRPYGGPYQQVNMDQITDFIEPTPHMVCYAADKGCPAAFVLEMSGNRDDVHALVINTDTVVEISLAAIQQVLREVG
jgi:zinc carboxypeptidase